MITEDYEIVREIYQLGIDTKNATFETRAPDINTWNKKFLPAYTFVSVHKNKIIGWIALSAVSDRCIYAGVCEVSCYVHPLHQGKGAGKLMLQKIICVSEQDNIWTLQAGIFPENIASLQLHKRSGFREIGYREKIGKMNGIWRNVILLERRSELIL